jgi:tetratricopeptide (TPR) repeat protein
MSSLAGNSEPAELAGGAGPAGMLRLRRVQRWLKMSIVLAALAAVVLAGVLLGQYLSGRQTSAKGSTAVDQRQLAAELVRGRALVDEGRDAQAFRLFAAVLKQDPGQPEALAYDGWLLRLTGVARHQADLARQGLALVRQAVALDPSYPDAHLFLGVMLDEDARDPIDAVAQLRLFLADKPTSALVRRASPVIHKVFADAHEPAPALP